MGHIGFQGLHDLSKVRSSKGMPYILVIIKTCDACMLGKQHIDCIKKNMRRTTRQNELSIHAHACGPFKHMLLGGSRFFITFTNDFSRKT
jgi:hypothetical protein